MTNVYQCKYCDQIYKRESLYRKHNCKYKKRYEEDIKTIYGQLSYQLYQEWLIAKYGAYHGDIDTFIKSKYYISFNKFAVFVQKIKLNDVTEYINYMVSLNIPVTLWYNITIYSEYLKLYEKNTPIIKQIKCSIKFLFKLADEYNCDIANIFDYVYFNDIYDLVIQRKLSLVLLFKSKKFHNFVASLSIEQQNLFEKIIDFKYYKTLLSNKKINSIVSQCVIELNI